MIIVISGAIAITILLTIFLENTGFDTFALPFIMHPLIFTGTFGLLAIFLLTGLAVLVLLRDILSKLVGMKPAINNST